MSEIEPTTSLNDPASAGSAAKMSDLEQILAKRKSLETELAEKKRSEKKLRLTVIAVLIAIFVLTIVLIFQYVLKMNEPPTNYFDLQLRNWKAVVAQYPKSPDAHANLGFIYYQKKDFPKALAEFDVALELNEKNLTALFFSGSIYKEQGKFDLAKERLLQSVEVAAKGKKYTAYFYLGEIAEEEGDEQAAFDYYTKSVADNTTTWNAHYNLGKIYEKRKQYSNALNEYKRALLFNPRNTEIKDAVARVEKLVPKK